MNEKHSSETENVSYCIIKRRKKDGFYCDTLIKNTHGNNFETWHLSKIAAYLLITVKVITLFKK